MRTKLTIFLFLILLIPTICYGALDSAIKWEIQTTGDSSSASMNNGGGFKAGATGTDYSFASLPANGAPILTLTDLACLDTATNLTSVTGGFTDAMVGNIVHIVSGTQDVPGWYEITARTDTNTVVIDRTCAVGGQNMTAATGNVGGCLALGSLLDNDFFGIVPGGNTVYIKSGSHSLGEAILVVADLSTTLLPLEIEGYDSTRDDNPTGTNRPLIATAALGMRLNDDVKVCNLRFTGTANYCLYMDAGGVMENCYFYNSSTSTGRHGSQHQGSDGKTINCEGISTNGNALSVEGGNTGGLIEGCYAHDSARGIYLHQNRAKGTFNIAESCLEGIFIDRNGGVVNNNTTYYCIDGIDIQGIAYFSGRNNIIDTSTTGATSSDNDLINAWDYNNWNGNGTDATNVTKGANATATVPGFTDVTVLSGTVATTSGGVLDAEEAIDMSGIVINQDFCWIKSGTGVTANEFHLITVVDDGNDQITLSPDPGDSAGGDISWSVTTGHDFSLGVAMKAGGFPGAFQGGLTTGYLDQGAVQRQEAGAGGGGTWGHF